MQVEKRLMELGEQVQANGSDVQDDKAAVLLGPLALNEAICLEAVHEPGDVRYPRDHLGQDCLGWQPGFAVTSQDSQDVVLLRRNAMTFEERLEPTRQEVGRSEQIERHLLPRAFEWHSLVQFFLQ